MADCTRKINQKLTLLENSTIEPIKDTTSTAKTSIKSTINTAKTLTKYITGVAKHVTEHAALHILTKDITSAAKISTKNFPSVARKLLHISMISATPFNHIVQKLQNNLRIQIFSVSLEDINIALAPKKHTNPAIKLPTKYQDFLNVFL